MDDLPEIQLGRANSALAVLGAARNLQPRYNISPTDTKDVIRLGADGKPELVPMRWGLGRGLIKVG